MLRTVSGGIGSVKDSEQGNRGCWVGGRFFTSKAVKTIAVGSRVGVEGLDSDYEGTMPSGLVLCPHHKTYHHFPLLIPSVHSSVEVPQIL